MKKVKSLVESDKKLINSQAKIGETPFLISCSYGNIEVAKYLLSLPETDIAKPNSLGHTPFFAACCSGMADVVKTLLNGKKVVINSKKECIEVAGLGKAEVLSFFLEQDGLFFFFFVALLSA